VSTILFLFLDGVGLGLSDPSINPFDHDFPAINRLAGHQRWVNEARPIASNTHVFRPIDANLNMEGLPQSGTGQATLFSGVNCARVAGRHFGPYPHSKTHQVLATYNLFTQVKSLFSSDPEPCAFANAYPREFFDRARARHRWTVTTLCCIQSGVRIRELKDLNAGYAITADMTGQGWQQMLGYDTETITEYEAGNRFSRIGQNHRLALFEYFLTDKSGHANELAPAIDILHAVDAFLLGMLSEFHPDRDLILITSDHGNLEDLSTRSHTRNPVPLVAFGLGADRFAGIQNITQVTPKILKWFMTF